MVLATLGMILPAPKLFAADGKTDAPTTKVAKNKIPDISLAGGVFAGRVVDHTGAPIEGAEVVVKQGKKEVTRVVTNEKGLFQAKEMKGGVYQVSSGNTDGVFRVWTENAAPPSAKGHALLVMGENGARGQFGAVDPALLLLTAAVIATLIVSAITLNEVQQTNDKVNQIVISN